MARTVKDVTPKHRVKRVLSSLRHPPRQTSGRIPSGLPRTRAGRLNCGILDRQGGIMDKTIVLDTPAQINGFRLLTIRQGLKAEVHGYRLTSKGPSCLSIVRKEFGIKARNAEAALPLFEAYLREIGILV